MTIALLAAGENADRFTYAYVVRRSSRWWSAPQIHFDTSPGRKQTISLFPCTIAIASSTPRRAVQRPASRGRNRGPQPTKVHGRDLTVYAGSASSAARTLTAAW